MSTCAALRCAPVVYGCSVNLAATLQVTTLAAEDGSGKVQGNEQGKSSRHDGLPYEERRPTKLIYSDVKLHLQVRIKINHFCPFLATCYNNNNNNNAFQLMMS